MLQVIEYTGEIVRVNIADRREHLTYDSLVVSSIITDSTNYTYLLLCLHEVIFAYIICKFVDIPTRKMEFYHLLVKNGILSSTGTNITFLSSCL